MPEIQFVLEGVRGCGWRKKGALYLVGPPLAASCCRLPMAIRGCPTCGGGIKFSRGWTWINLYELLLSDSSGPICEKPDLADNQNCPIGQGQVSEKVGLIWVGEAFYPTITSFIEEAVRVGISRRIHTVPRDFVLGETWVALAHKKGYFNSEPGIFSLFIPSRIEYIMKGDESEEEIERLINRGITPIKVKPRRNPRRAGVAQSAGADSL